MLLHDKDILLNNFMAKWGDKFNSIPTLVKLLIQTPELDTKMENLYEISLEELKCSQRDWLSLLSKLEHPAEKSFFKEYFVPIQTHHYDYFIDISTTQLSLFKPCYYQYYLDTWYKVDIFRDLHAVLFKINKRKFKLKSHFKIVERNKEMIQSILRVKMDEFGVQGLLTKGDRLLLDYYFEERFDFYCTYYEYKPNCLKIHRVFPNIIYFLPHDSTITLEYFSDLKPFPYINLSKTVKTIRALSYVIENTGAIGIWRLSFTFDSDPLNRVDFMGNTFTLKHKSKEFIDGFFDKYKSALDNNHYSLTQDELDKLKLDLNHAGMFSKNDDSS